MISDRRTKLQQMLDIDPRDTFCLYGLAQEHASAGEFAAAIELYDRLLLCDSTQCYSYFHKARCQQRLGDLLGAADTLKAGRSQAQAAGDTKAAGEIEAFLTELEK